MVKCSLEDEPQVLGAPAIPSVIFVNENVVVVDTLHSGSDSGSNR